MRFFGQGRALILMFVLLGSVGTVYAQTADDEQIDQILTRLQARGEAIRDLSTRVRFVEEDRVNLTKRVKIGTVTYQMAEPNPRFMIHFERTEVDGILGKQEWYLFDGRWLYDVIERIEQVTKNEIAPPGKKFDPFDLETAPFPLPFGQKKETIQRNFEVSLLPPQPADPPDTDHLLCEPKPGSTFHGKWDTVEFFVHRALHLPTRIIVVKNDGFESVQADFPELSNDDINTGLSGQDFAPPALWNKYKWVVEGPGASVESPPRD